MTHSGLHCADGHSDFVKACKKRTEGRLSLEHAGTSIDETAPYDADGPYDVVISDMALMQLMQALMQVGSSLLHGVHTNLQEC